MRSSELSLPTVLSTGEILKERDILHKKQRIKNIFKFGT